MLGQRSVCVLNARVSRAAAEWQSEAPSFSPSGGSRGFAAMAQARSFETSGATRLSRLLFEGLGLEYPGEKHAPPAVPLPLLLAEVFSWESLAFPSLVSVIASRIGCSCGGVREAAGERAESSCSSDDEALGSRRCCACILKRVERRMRREGNIPIRLATNSQQQRLLLPFVRVGVVDELPKGELLQEAVSNTAGEGLLSFEPILRSRVQHCVDEAVDGRLEALEFLFEASRSTVGAETLWARRCKDEKQRRSSPSPDREASERRRREERPCSSALAAVWAREERPQVSRHAALVRVAMLEVLMVFLPPLQALLSRRKKRRLDLDVGCFGASWRAAVARVAEEAFFAQRAFHLLEERSSEPKADDPGELNQEALRRAIAIWMELLDGLLQEGSGFARGGSSPAREKATTNENASLSGSEEEAEKEPDKEAFPEKQNAYQAVEKLGMVAFVLDCVLLPPPLLTQVLLCQCYPVAVCRASQRCTNCAVGLVVKKALCSNGSERQSEAGEAGPAPGELSAQEEEDAEKEPEASLEQGQEGARPQRCSDCGLARLGNARREELETLLIRKRRALQVAQTEAQGASEEESDDEAGDKRPHLSNKKRGCAARVLYLQQAVEEQERMLRRGTCSCRCQVEEEGETNAENASSPEGASAFSRRRKAPSVHHKTQERLPPSRRTAESRRKSGGQSPVKQEQERRSNSPPPNASAVAAQKDGDGEISATEDLLGSAEKRRFSKTQLEENALVDEAISPERERISKRAASSSLLWKRSTLLLAASEERDA